jgi:hypothetical protein
MCSLSAVSPAITLLLLLCRTDVADEDTDVPTVAGAVRDPESVVSQVHMYVLFLLT